MAAHAKLKLILGMLIIIFISLLPAAVAEITLDDFLRKEFSLTKPYQDAHLNIPFWDYVGSTMVTNSYIRLTPDVQSKQGGVWNKVACHIKDWEVQIHFKVHGRGKSLYGDGFAFWYTKERNHLGPVFGSKDNFRGLGIFFDTYSNHNGPHNHGHPYISAMVSNGSLSYDHDRDGTHTQISGCQSLFRNRKQETWVSIRYSGDRLTLKVNIDDKNQWRDCLDVEGIRLPTGFYFGLTAATGDLADNHDIITTTFYELDTPRSKKNTRGEEYRNIEPSADFFSPPRDHVDDSNVSQSTFTGFKLFMLVVCAILGAIVCLIVGAVIYKKRLEHNSKRFY